LSGRGDDPFFNKPITAIWSAKMTYVAHGLFSVFFADMEMQCTPQALFLPFNRTVEGEISATNLTNTPKSYLLAGLIWITLG
jgi:hypothetical protein